ncbi:F-box protein At3g07870-like [Papaver somniferum]|uniref:F-box protein At3g07870-like n=1 Tax=Papaver somniferum TaxID=3469 RepID=UPI000E70329E|nr:F-box protein At3g07870-like [Papaver somniferum]
MENLHSDLLENILSRLPTEPALHAKRVCTTWRAILRKKTERSGFLFRFSHAESKVRVRRQLFYEDEYDHYDHAKINYYHSDKTRSEIEHGIFFTSTFHPKDIIVGSCNYLVCFGKAVDLGPVPSQICNPLTGECVFLPQYNTSKYPGGSVSNGFGYFPKTNKYKVVTIHFNHMNQEGHIQVYTVGGCKWRYVGFISCFDRDGYDYSSGVYANGALYWLHECVSGRLQEEEQSQIVAFYLEGETLRHIELPDSGSPDKLLGGNNNLYLVYTNCESSCIDIWVYKNSGTG